ncbi:hypothetical protein XK27_11070 [Streptococcus suis]|nr:hypothetical protein A7J10_10410 [Streptococcus suis]KPA63813.1 hypothetical protein XK27_11070 [Streptococcus suis]
MRTTGLIFNHKADTITRRLSMEDKLAQFIKQNPKLYSLIMNYLEGNIPKEEVDRFLAMDEEDRKEWVMKQMEMYS